MTTEERLSSAERHIAELQDQTSTLAQGQTAHDAILDRMGEVLDCLGFAYVDTGNRLGRIEALVQDQGERLGRIEALVQDHTRTLQGHSVDLSAIRAVLGQDQDEPDP